MNLVSGNVFGQHSVYEEAVFLSVSISSLDAVAS